MLIHEVDWSLTSCFLVFSHSKGLSNQADVELDMINAISVADIAFIMPTAVWLAQLVERQSAEREVYGSSPRPDQHSGS